MAFLSRWVYGYVCDAGGTPVVGGQVKAKLNQSLSFTTTHIIAEREFYVVTDSIAEANADPILAKEPGKFRIKLWCDETALKTVDYELFFPVVDGGGANTKLSLNLSLAYEDGSPKFIGEAIIEGADPDDITDSVTLGRVIDERISLATSNHVAFNQATVANQAARLALQNLRKYYHLNQADNGQTFILINEAESSNNSSWLNLTDAVNTDLVFPSSVTSAWIADDLNVILADNAAVSSAPNKLFGQVALTSAGAARPLLKKGIFNSRSVLRFDGTDDFLTAGSNFELGTQSLNLFFVAKRNGISGTPGGRGFAGGAVGRYSLTVTQGSFYGALYQNQTTTQTAESIAALGTVDSEFYLYEMKILRSGTLTLYRNGVLLATTAFTADAAQNLNSGLDFFVGKYSAGAGTFLNGDIAAVIICRQPGDISIYDRTKFYNSLGKYYGIAFQ